MAYPLENEHVDYLDYLEQHAMGSSDQGPAMSKDAWRKWRQAQQATQAKAQKDYEDGFRGVQP